MRDVIRICAGALSSALLWTTAAASANQPPIAIDDRVETSRGRAVLIDVLANDSDRDGNLLSVTIVANNLPSPAALVDHGDGSFTYTPSADHASGSFTFEYRISDGQDGAEATATVVVDRPTEPAPGAAHFTFSCSSLTCDFDGSASSDPVGIVGYGWDFGDGSTASGALVTHTFGAGGTYPVTLTITNTDGGTSSTSSDVIVGQGNQQPVAGDDSLWTPQDTQLNILFGRDLLQNDSDPDGDSITFHLTPKLPDHGQLNIGNSIGGTYTPDPGFSGIDTFQYTVFDGALESAPALVTITVDAPPVAAFTASCSGRTCTLDGSSSTDDLGIASYSWDFGDGTTGSGATVSHTYATGGTFRVTLTVTDSHGQTDFVFVDLTLDDPPVASFTSTCTGRSCTFDGSGSSDDLGIASYGWSFGDGTTGAGATASHTYATSGTYSVSLEVTDTGAQTDSTVQTVQLVVGVDDLYTVPFGGSVSDSLTSLLANDEGPNLLFAGVVTQPASGTLTLPGGTGFLYTPTSCVAEDAFVYRVESSTATSSSDTATVRLDVLPDQLPVAAFDLACNLLTCQPTDLSSDDSGYQIVSWDFGDGTTSTAAAPAHTYAAGGTYTITLTVVDLCGQVSTASQSVLVGLPPSAAFTVSCDELDCTFDASASTDDNGIASYAWSFGDGQGVTASVPTATHEYRHEGSYLVELTVVDVEGKSDLASQTVEPLDETLFLLLLLLGK